MRGGGGTGRPGRLAEFGTEIRWTVVVVVTAVLLAVALWPRGSDESGDGGSGNGGTGDRAGVTAPSARGSDRTADPARLAELRARARLDRCTGARNTTRPTPALAGASGTCMATGEPVDLAAVTAGKPALINVWASWCAPCREELPALQAYAERPGSVRVVGVQVQSDPAAGLELLDRLGVHFPNVHDTDRRISEVLRVPRVIPASYVLTSSGSLRRLPPEVFDSPGEVDAAVDRALNEQTLNEQTPEGPR